MKFGREVLYKDGGSLGRSPTMTNNIAEFTAFIQGMKYLNSTYLKRPVTIKGDSKLVVELVNGNWYSKKPHIQKLLGEALQEMGYHVKKVTVLWIPREENQEADQMSHEVDYE